MMLKLFIGSLGAVVAMVSCGKSGGAPRSHPAGEYAPTDVVLRVSNEGGLMLPEMRLNAYPSFTLLGDGRVFALGPQIEIYPPPALPNIVVRSLTSDGFSKVVEAARSAGLDGADARYDRQGVADAGWTTFAFLDEAHKTHRISAYALNIGGDQSGDSDARKKLEELNRKLGSLEQWLPQGSAGSDSQYVSATMRVLFGPYVARQGDPKQAAKAWPLKTSLESFGKPYSDGLRCAVVEGEEHKQLIAAARSASSATPWTSGSKQYRVIFHPLFPGEAGCEPPQANKPNQ
ncbi:MAG: hypothetical protein NVSMB57_10540 [Actinomycetota bacterium]